MNPFLHRDKPEEALEVKKFTYRLKKAKEAVKSMEIMIRGGLGPITEEELRTTGQIAKKQKTAHVFGVDAFPLLERCLFL